MMTKSDFQAVADSFNVQVGNLRTVREAIAETGSLDTVTGPKSVTLSTMAYDLAQRFSTINPRFDHMVFYKACGFEVRDNWPVVFTDNI